MTDNKLEVKIPKPSSPEYMFECVKCGAAYSEKQVVCQFKQFTDSEECGSTEFKMLTENKITYEEWQDALLKRYTELQRVINQNLPHVWASIELELAVKSILHIKGCNLPFAAIILGAPSTSKTFGIELFRNEDVAFYTDKFTPKSFVSHSTSVKNKQELEKIDLLPKIKDKLFLTPELSPIFSARDDDLLEILGIMTRVLDGQGYENDSGAYGHRGYKGEHMFVWIGAAVDIPRKVYNKMGSLGPKIYFYRLSKVKKTDNDYLQIFNDDFGMKKKAIEEALGEYLNWFKMCPTMTITNALEKIEWDSQKDELQAKNHIIKLGKLLAHLRGVVTTWETNDTQGADYGYSTQIIEEPSRAITQLYNLARGHALSQGRNFITEADIPIVIKVALSTASVERVSIFDILLEWGGTLTTSQIEYSLNTSKPTARRTMTELKALELVDMEKSGDYETAEWKITLKGAFDWFKSDEFRQLREGFIPNSEFLKPKSNSERAVGAN